MENAKIHNEKYMLYKAARSGEIHFIKINDDDRIQAFRDRNNNADLLKTTWQSTEPDMSAPRIYSIVFHIAANNIEVARISAIEAISYAGEFFSIPDDNVEIICIDSGGSNTKNSDVGINNSGSGNSIGNNSNNNNNGKISQSLNKPPTAVKTSNAVTGSKNASESCSPIEILILIPPEVYKGISTPLIPRLNYRLARQMSEDGINNIDIDSCLYLRDSYIPLPNSINSTTGRHAIPLSLKELMYLDGQRIAELSKQPRPDDSLIQPSEIPAAVEWYAEILAEYKQQALQQDELKKLMIKNGGWGVPECLRRWLRLCLYDNVRLEIYRIISQYFSWIGANKSEIQQLITNLDSRNPIMNYPKLNNIIVFGNENAWLTSCRHPLLQKFCPGRCFISELIEKYEKPYLFMNCYQDTKKL